MEFTRVYIAVLLMFVQRGIHGESPLQANCQQKKIDLAFVIDSSRSISDEDFKLQMKFVRSIVSILDVGTHNTRVAAVSFSNFTIPEFGFKDHGTKEAVIKAITNIKHSKGDATRTYDALNYTREVIFGSRNGERPQAIDVVIVLTDGVTNPGNYDRHWSESAKRQTQIEADLLKNRPAYIFAIGVGSEIDKAELNGISSDPDEVFTILVKSFKDLNSEDVKNMLLDKTCASNIVQTTSLPPVQTTPSCQESKEVDVFFIIDESSSLNTQENFKKELTFVGSVIKDQDVGPSKVRVGIMKFGTNPQILLHLDNHMTKTEISALLDAQSKRWKGGNTYLDRALNLLMTEGLSTRHGGRKNVQKTVVIITDGQSTDPEKTSLAVNEMKKLKYKVYAIGVGPEIDFRELSFIASDKSHVFTVDSVDRLKEIQKDLVTNICQGDQTPQPITCKGAEADIFFLMDSSTSIGFGSYEIEKKFAKSVVTRLTNDTNSIKVGLILFSNDAEFSFKLATYRDSDEIAKAIERIPYKTGNTNTHKALDLLLEQGFLESNGARKNVPKIVIIITDGESRNRQRTKELADEAKRRGIIMFSIGVGQYINRVELDNMASVPKELYSFSVKDFASLSSIERSLAKRTCSAANPGIP